MLRSVPLPPSAAAVASKIPAGGPITQALIEIAHISKTDRVLATGSLGVEIFLELHRRGCSRVAATAACGLPRGQYDVAVVGWRGDSLKALETTLNWLVHFLGPSGALAVWVGNEEGTADSKLKTMLRRFGFRVEAGTACENGLAVVARRLQCQPSTMAA